MTFGLLKGVSNLASDAYGFSKQKLFGPEVGFMGEVIPYSPQNGIVRSVMTKGGLATAGDIAGGMVTNAPGIGTINALYRRNPEQFGASLPALALAGAGAESPVAGEAGALSGEAGAAGSLGRAGLAADTSAPSLYNKNSIGSTQKFGATSTAEAAEASTTVKAPSTTASLSKPVAATAENSEIAARQQIANVEKIEPQVTQVLSEAAAANGGEMLGLQYRFKSVESLARKMADQPGIPINDALRYTISFDEADFTAGVKSAMAKLKEDGYKPTVLRNTFKDGQPYKGINSTYLTPEGEMFELQFHTPESFQMKDIINHPLYEQQRVLPRTDPLWGDLRNQMIENSSNVPNPPNVSTIKKPKADE